MNKLQTRFLLIFAIVCCSALVAGLMQIDSPTVARQKRIDVERVNDLSDLANTIAATFLRKKTLPATLDISDPNTMSVVRRKDPETGTEYEYIRDGDEAYQLCATFSMSVLQDIDSIVYRRRQLRWLHGAGRHCFRFSAISSVPIQH